MAWKSRFFCASIIFLICTAIARAEPPASQTTEYAGHGQWRQISTPSPEPELIDDPTLDRVEQLVDARQIADAHALLSPWLKEHPKAPDRDRGLFLLAEIYFQQDDRLTAFYHLDELMDNYPSSRFFGLALQKQYAIGDAFLSGHKRKFLGLHILGAEDEGIEILYRVQERSPGSALAERALLRTADFYFRGSQFDLAADAYGAFARSYPRSPDVSYVKLREAFSSLAQFRGARYDSTPLLDARAQFADFLEKYPALAAQENVRERIDRIDNTLADKLYLTGDFFVRTHKPIAAAYVYRYALQRYPAAPVAGTIRGALSQLPAFALQSSPPPAVSDTEFPATAPVPENAQ
jgi:outer membrane protein assembly factor BamD (BamD/ComL family)